MKSFTSNLPKYMAYLSAGIIALMPFHAFMTVWAASGLGHYTLLRLWKEVLLSVLLLGGLWLLVRDTKARTAFRNQPLMWFIVLYGAILVGVGLVALIVDGVSLKAYLYGLLLDSRFLVFFCATWVSALYSDLLVRAWKKLLLIPAAIVVGFATLQYTLLPNDVLRHFGYGAATIESAITVDEKDAYTRVQSTMRGPNPLGAYLIIILSALGMLALRLRRNRVYAAAFYVLSGAALVFTFSRSAWIGAFISMLLIGWLALNSRKLRKMLLIFCAAAVLAFGLTAYVLRNNDHFQNIFFHTNEHSQSAESSNEGHMNAVTEGVKDIIRAPWGEGTGTAGPASVYNSQPARISENYFLQVGQEVGVGGLLLFVLINCLVVKLLWQRRDYTLGVVLLVSFAGISVVNLFMHAWTDDTLAYIWWGLAGAMIAMPRKKRIDETDK